MQRLITVYAGDDIRNRTEMILDARRVRPGMPATILHPQDRYAAKVVSVSSSGHAIRVSSACGALTFTWRKGEGVGQFVQAGQTSPALALGFAEDHRCREI